MSINEYIEKTGITYRAFSKLCGVSPSMLYRLRVGTRGKSISLDIAQKIVKGTKGLVTIEDLMKVYKK